MLLKRWLTELRILSTRLEIARRITTLPSRRKFILFVEHSKKRKSNQYHWIRTCLPLSADHLVRSSMAGKKVLPQRSERRTRQLFQLHLNRQIPAHLLALQPRNDVHIITRHKPPRPLHRYKLQLPSSKPFRSESFSTGLIDFLRSLLV